MLVCLCGVFFFSQKAAYEMRISEWSSDVCSSDRPRAPRAAEEMWSRLGHEGSLAWEPFPEAEPVLLVDDDIEVPVQINGKVKARIHVASGLDAAGLEAAARAERSEEHTSELQSLMRISYAVFCLKKKTITTP